MPICPCTSFKHSNSSKIEQRAHWSWLINFKSFKQLKILVSKYCLNMIDRNHIGMIFLNTERTLENVNKIIIQFEKYFSKFKKFNTLKLPKKSENRRTIFSFLFQSYWQKNNSERFNWTSDFFIAPWLNFPEKNIFKVYDCVEWSLINPLARKLVQN